VFSLRDHRSNTVPQASRGRPALLCSRPFGRLLNIALTIISALGVETFSRFKAFAQADMELCAKLGHENQLERCPQVSVRRIFVTAGASWYFLGLAKRSFPFFDFPQ
jgi:hypothetical protein